MDREPGDVLRDIEKLNEELINLGDDYSTARIQFANLEFEYEKEIAKGLIEEYNAGLERGKVPAEDIRRAKSHLALDTKVWKQYLVGKARCDALKSKISTRQSVLSGLQSELQQMRVEYTHA